MRVDRSQFDITDMAIRIEIAYGKEVNGGKTWEERIKFAMQKWVGAYSLAILTRDGVFAVRDPWGFRPLCIGLLPSGGHAVASETGALQTLGCEAIRDVKPGEIVALSNNALTVTQALPAVTPLSRCVFEHIYFARPDQVWGGIGVHKVRQRLGEELAREVLNGLLRETDKRMSSTDVGTDKRMIADVVIPVPDSSIPAAIGF